MTMGRTAVRCPAVVVLYFVCMGLYPILGLKVESLTSHGEVGGIATLNCTVSSEKAEIQWLFKDKPLNSTRKKTEEKIIKQPSKDLDETQVKVSELKITNVTSEDAGNYTCVASYGDTKDMKVENLDLYFEPKFIEASTTIHTNLTDNENITMECVFDVYNLTHHKWYKKDSEEPYNYIPEIQRINERQVKITHSTTIRKFNQNGTYICEIEDGASNKAEGTVEVLVYDQPKISDSAALGISTTELYLNWTLLLYNHKIENIKIHIYYRTSNQSTTLMSYGDGTTVKNSSTVMSGLKKNTTYFITFGVQLKNFEIYKTNINKPTVGITLASDPVFVPNITINGFSATSVTIGWAPPSKEIEQFIHFYLLEANKKDNNESRKAYHSRDGRNLPYMFDNLEPHSTYVFQVRACSDYVIERCGNWSEKMEAATLDGIPSKPTNVVIDCSFNRILLNWSEPALPRAEIKGYTMELTGNATFKDRYGQIKEVTWGPLSKFTKNDSRNEGFNDLQPNTNYTVRLSAMTRTRRRGEEETKSCTTAPAPPDHPPRPRWRKIYENNKYMFKMYLPRISERNGPICCYRVYMVRMLPQTEWKNLSEPMSMPVLDYNRVHAEPPVLAAYITDIFSNDKFPADSELVMGDNQSLYDDNDKTLNTPACQRCLVKPKRESDVVPTTVLTSTTSTTTPSTPADTPADILDDDDDNSTVDPVSPPETPKTDRRRRSINSDSNGDSPNTLEKPQPENSERFVFDGELDSSAKYTLFVELIPGIENEPPLFSNYVNVLQAEATPSASQSASTLEIALQVTCAVAALILLLMIVFCIRQSRRSRKHPPHPNFEMNAIQSLISKWRGHGSRQQMVATVPPDMPPIAKEDLPDAYAERQVDSDYGFQKEFEHINMLQYNAERVPKTTKLLQMLPECFPDRTTHASEARENQPKNRYPDIKAYDQTRVKLSQIDSITGSDYINANFVRGYQERKQFICAQGPTETTVNDFWRMIWEHGLELIVMLTNLEEYSKVKCSKYWPDEIRGSRAFGTITVHHVSEKRYSDYIVRELKITKQATNADGQPIVENNGVAKRNGDIKEAADGSVPTSPREVKEAESRTVRQYHFLMWKDFAAPEHAYSILKFIKRVNEAWSTTLSRPCVVHCSAGVGRTGTLVALDCLLHQLRAEGHAAVFNTVAELRTQRNFLVQSLKQYVFVYRALVEYTVYGDTEIPAHRLKAAVDRLRNTPPSHAHCLMEIEFEKILNSPIPEPIKSCAAGAAEELRSKNRSQDILPYDRNRVILAPIPTRDFSTYINASFIEAYDNSEGFIITQDPLPNTITDFWRMVSEHNVTTIVMLSELGEGKCPRYWEDSLAQHDHIGVQYEESESCPYYTRRQFRVMNNKSGVSWSVRQLQYQGWPTAARHVPEVTRGVAELADAAAAAEPGAMLVHCQYGTERSALFVALCILISQLRAERRVDVCCVTRKVRSQRTHTIDTFLHYEFLHRAILNYAELHDLLEDS